MQIKDDDDGKFVVIDEPVIPYHDLWRPLFERVREMRKKTMQIKTVRYERLKKHDTEPFENERVGVEAQVEEGEDPVTVYHELRRLVNRDIFGEGLSHKEAQNILDQLDEAGASTEAIEKAAESLREQVVNGPKRRRVTLFPDTHQIGPPNDEKPVKKGGTIPVWGD